MINNKVHVSVQETKEIDEAKELLNFYRGLNKTAQAKLVGFSEGLYMAESIKPTDELKEHPTAS